MPTAMLEYSGKLILAPMVRVGTLPMRLMSLKYGADLVYSPEIIDRRLIKSQRIINHELGTIDFIDDTGYLNLRVHPSESKKLIVQIGTADPENAVAAALIVAGDVAGIDVNCGCPKRFSLISSMGSALLEDPERLIQILESLVKNVKLPITCKIRMLPSTKDIDFVSRTVEFAKRMESTGIKAIGVHCRFTHEKPRDPGHWEIFEHLLNNLKIPLIANGDFYSHSDIEKIKTKVPLTSFMIARGAQSNPSVFRREGLIHVGEMLKEYAFLAHKYQMHYGTTKYVILLFDMKRAAIPFKTKIASTKSYEELFSLLNATDMSCF